MATCAFLRKDGQAPARGPCATAPGELGAYELLLDGGPVTLAMDVETVDPETGVVCGLVVDDDGPDDGDDTPDEPISGAIVESWFVTPEKLQAIGLAADALPMRWWLGLALMPAAVATVEPGDRQRFSIVSDDSDVPAPSAPADKREDTMGVTRKLMMNTIEKLAEVEQSRHPELSAHQAMSRVLAREPIAKAAYSMYAGAAADPDAGEPAPEPADPNGPIVSPAAEAAWKAIEAKAEKLIDSGVPLGKTARPSRQQAIAHVLKAYPELAKAYDRA